MKERSLVAFTLLSQTAAGALWTAGLLLLWAGPAGADAWLRPALWGVGALMALALGASLLHLGRPLQAWRAPANALSSWLSREILSALFFAALSMALAGLTWFQAGTPLLRALVHGAAALAGLALLASMSSAYRLRTVPAWNHWATPAAFLLTAFLLGGPAAGLALAAAPDVPPEVARAALRAVAGGMVALLSLELIVIPLWVTALAAGSEAAAASAELLTRRYGPLFRWRLGLVVVGIGAAGVVLLGRLGLTGQIAALAAALAVVLAAEVCGRALFYQARVREGV